MQRAITPSLALTIAVVALLGACSSSNASEDDATDRDEGGEVVEGGDLGVFRLQVGDCVQLPGEAETGIGEVESFAAVPCEEPHTGEVVLVDDAHFADLDEYPGQDEALEMSAESCVDALGDYTGTSYDSSTFDVISLVPTADSWDVIDDRELVCVGATFDDEFTEILSVTDSFRAD